MPASLAQISKVRKLLAHARGTTRNGEAKSYRDLARKLMAMWGIEKSDLRERKPHRIALDTAPDLPLWERVLADACAMLHRSSPSGCKCRVRDQKMWLEGDEPTAVAAAAENYRWFRNKIQWMTVSFYGPWWSPSTHSSFAYGFACCLMHKAYLHRDGIKDPYLQIINSDNPEQAQEVFAREYAREMRKEQPSKPPPPPPDHTAPSPSDGAADGESTDGPDPLLDRQQRSMMNEAMIQAGGEHAAFECFDPTPKLPAPAKQPRQSTPRTSPRTSPKESKSREPQTVATDERRASPGPVWLWQS